MPEITCAKVREVLSKTDVKGNHQATVLCDSQTGEFTTTFICDCSKQLSRVKRGFVFQDLGHKLTYQFPH